MLRRLSPEQPESFAFTPANMAWARAQITKYPAGRQASAVIPLLWRAQEQEGWLTRPAIEYVSDMLGMAHIRALEVATFYFMFQLHPIGSIANVQICGTTTCMICGAESLMAVCREKIAPKPHTLSADGKFTWEEVECLGACTNAPMVQIGKDFYEDLTPESFAAILDALAAGQVPTPGPQNGRVGAEPLGGPKVLAEDIVNSQNASVALAVAIGDTVKKIEGTEVPLLHPWKDQGGRSALAEEAAPATLGKTEAPVATTTGAALAAADAVTGTAGGAGTEPVAPPRLDGPRDGRPDDLRKLKGIGPKVLDVLADLGIYHFDQIAAWTPAELAWIDANMPGFTGRASRDDWVGQAAAVLGRKGGN